MANPAAVFALVLAMTAVGASMLTWTVPTFGQVRAGFEMLVGTTVALLGWSAYAAFGGPIGRVLEADPTSVVGATRPFLLALVGLSVAAVVLRLLRFTPLVPRVLGLAATLAGLASLWPLAVLRAQGGGAGGVAQGVAELLLGTALLGSI
jgi:hypothetical protein